MMRQVMPAAWLRRGLCALALLSVAAGAPARAQDLNVVLPIPEIEERLLSQSFRILHWTGSRRPDDRTQRATLGFEDSVVLIAKWANAPQNGWRFNNEPRNEVAAYEIQKLFLDESEYVVPPTVMRVFPIEFVREYMPEAKPTFGAAPGSVVVALQYWLSSVTPQGFWDAKRARSDTLYARHIANFNIFTFLVRHSDANVGNYLISTAEMSPRVFSVDNGIAFGSDESDKGFAWRELQVDRFPRRTIERLRTITRQQLEETLEVVAEFEVQGGQLVPVEPGPTLNRNVGVRREGNRIQFGLTRNEIRQVEQRINSLLRDVSERRLF